MSAIKIDGVRIDNVTLSEAVEAALAKRGAPCFVVTPNAVMLEACGKETRLADLLNLADLSLPDGRGVLMAAGRQGQALRERVAGIEFGEALLARASVDGARVFLLGGGEDVAQEAAKRLCVRFPNLRICGTCWGYFDRTGEEDRRLTEIIRACRPDILLVCMGFPLQEEWIASHISLLGDVRVVAGLGGSLDVWAGRIKRAPTAVSRMGMEWAWRMIGEPKRMKKLPALMRFWFKTYTTAKRPSQKL